MRNIYPYLEGTQLRALVRFDAEQNDIIEIAVSGPEPVHWVFDIVAGQSLDVLLLGPNIDKPGRYDWRIRACGHSAF